IRKMALSMNTKCRGVFVAQVGDAFTGTRVFMIVTKHLQTYQGQDYDYQTSDQVGSFSLMNSMWTKGQNPGPIGAVVIVPTGNFIVRDGETRTYTFASFIEESETGGNEN